MSRGAARTEVRHATRRRIFVCSPLSGDLPGNTVLAEDLCKAAIAVGCAPFAPHLFFTRFLDEETDLGRQAGIECGKAWLRAADEMWIFSYDADGCSNGMFEEIELAKTLLIPPKLIWMPQPWRAFIGRGVFTRSEQPPKPSGRPSVLDS